MDEDVLSTATDENPAKRQKFDSIHKVQQDIGEIMKQKESILNSINKGKKELDYLKSMRKDMNEHITQLHKILKYNETQLNRLHKKSIKILNTKLKLAEQCKKMSAQQKDDKKLKDFFNHRINFLENEVEDYENSLVELQIENEDMRSHQEDLVSKLSKLTGSMRRLGELEINEEIINNIKNVIVELENPSMFLSKLSTNLKKIEQLVGVSSDDSNICMVCKTAVMDTCCVPCGHFCACYACSTALETCPLCRSQIKIRQKIFF